MIWTVPVPPLLVALMVVVDTTVAVPESVVEVTKSTVVEDWEVAPFLAVVGVSTKTVACRPLMTVLVVVTLPEYPVVTVVKETVAGVSVVERAVEVVEVEVEATELLALELDVVGTEDEVEREERDVCCAEAVVVVRVAVEVLVEVAVEEVDTMHWDGSAAMLLATEVRLK